MSYGELTDADKRYQKAAKNYRKTAKKSRISLHYPKRKRYAYLQLEEEISDLRDPDNEKYEPDIFLRQLKVSYLYKMFEWDD